MNTQSVSDHGRLHMQGDVLGAVIASKFDGTIKGKIEMIEMITVQQELTSGGTDRAAQNVVRTSVGDDDAPIIFSS